MRNLESISKHYMDGKTYFHREDIKELLSEIRLRDEQIGDMQKEMIPLLKFYQQHRETVIENLPYPVERVSLGEKAFHMDTPYGGE